MVKIYYDLETTGVNYRKNSIIELGGLIEVDGKIVDEFHYLIRPHPKAIIEPSALRVNKKTEEEIMAYPEMKIVLKQFKRKLGKYIDKYNKKDKAWLIGFNNRAFDDFFLRKFFELCGDQFIGSWFWVDTIDTLCLASQYLLDRRAEMPSFKLKRVAMELGIQVDKKALHGAQYDVEITRRIYRIVTGLEKELLDDLF